ncbi:MAG: hypothetical protein IPP48_00710 [Chitinophagaceae bacterium]|nr:hypothetical protein [Chitinophagaceae bacterium]
MKKITVLVALCIFSGVALYAQDSLKQYVAKYKFPEGSAVTEIEVVIENGGLVFQSSLGNTAVEKTGTDEFSIPAYNGTAFFTRNEAKKITGLHIEAQGTVLDGTIVEPKPAESGTKDEILYNQKYLLTPQVPYHNF